jgi:ubiquinone/menaquinone biosynthesis C-methylase UbiE
MLPVDDAKKRAAATYNAAADFYDHPTNTFWEHYGRRTVEHLRLPAGARVLDVCCGSGASAIPAAEAVGPGGSVIGVDLAENLLELAHTKARQCDLTNIEFHSGDMTDLPFPDNSFDAVVCVFGIFFVPDMEAALRELSRVTHTGGRVAVTTWGPKFFEPVNTVFWNSVRNVQPELYKGFNPWDRISDVDALRSLLSSAGLEELGVVAEAGSAGKLTGRVVGHVLGTGYRGTVEQLSDLERERVRAENLDFIRCNEVGSVEASVVYGVGVKQR